MSPAFHLHFSPSHWDKKQENKKLMQGCIKLSMLVLLTDVRSPVFSGTPNLLAYYSLTSILVISCKPPRTSLPDSLTETVLRNNYCHTIS